jgi:hypothetical protein
MVTAMEHHRREGAPVAAVPLVAVAVIIVLRENHRGANHRDCKNREVT